jgi:type 1 glutamine amidotransferase
MQNVLSLKISATAAILILTAAVAFGPAAKATAAEPSAKIRVLIVTGGHDFDRKGFFALWDTFGNVAWREATQGKSSEAFTAENLENCDVVALYDMVQPITDEQKAAFLGFLQRGGGLVALHHCIASYQQWDRFHEIIGGKYLLNDEVREGRKIPKSDYEHDIDLNVQIADPKHPITRGIKGFATHDEIYKGVVVDPEAHVLLTTDHPESGKKLAWTRREGKARVVYIQLGHDNQAYSNPNYRRIVRRAVAWAAGRSQAERE